MIIGDQGLVIKYLQVLLNEKYNRELMASSHLDTDTISNLYDFILSDKNRLIPVEMISAINIFKIGKTNENRKFDNDGSISIVDNFKTVRLNNYSSINGYNFYFINDTYKEGGEKGAASIWYGFQNTIDIVTSLEDIHHVSEISLYSMKLRYLNQSLDQNGNRYRYITLCLPSDIDVVSIVPIYNDDTSILLPDSSEYYDIADEIIPYFSDISITNFSNEYRIRYLYNLAFNNSGGFIENPNIYDNGVYTNELKNKIKEIQKDNKIKFGFGYCDPVTENILIQNAVSKGVELYE